MDLELYTKLSNCIKALSADAVEKAASGHPGMPMGMSDVMTVLVRDFLKFHPQDPKWHGRDRLVLSAGHGSMLLYSFYYLTGYRDFTLDDIKNFRALGSKTPGHPEYGTYEAVETTTGPLGQGLANSVGMAIAGKKYQHHIGDCGSYKVYCIVGDGCLMEGISYEAMSLAGHLRLNNLIVLFDDNHISIDGSTNLATSEDHIKKFQAMGWNCWQVDGHDFIAIKNALEQSQNSDKPCFIAMRTTIAKGANKKAGSEVSHGSALGKEEVSHLKQHIGFKDESFWIPAELLDTWRQTWQRNNEYYNRWQQQFVHLPKNQQDYFKLQPIHADIIAKSARPSSGSEATRVSSGRILQELMSGCDKIICGSADLASSNNVKNSATKAITADDFSGNFLHYGVREHAMGGIMNGLALSGFLPVGGTFFVFSDYMRASIRLAAIMKLHVIYIMTHDSIGVGEDGATHQPIEHLASFRAMPNLLLFRPADFQETLECWQLALQQKGPSMLVLTRQNVKQLRLEAEDNLCQYGAYVLEGLAEESEALIFASGSEVEIAIEVAHNLNDSLKITVISMPSMELLFCQPKEYISKLTSGNRIKIAIEAASQFGWHKIIGISGMFFGLDEFGESAPSQELYKHFKLTAGDISEKIRSTMNPKML